MSKILVKTVSMLDILKDRKMKRNQIPYRRDKISDFMGENHYQNDNINYMQNPNEGVIKPEVKDQIKVIRSNEIKEIPKKKLKIDAFSPIAERIILKNFYLEEIKAIDVDFSIFDNHEDVVVDQLISILTMINEKILDMSELKEGSLYARAYGLSLTLRNEYKHKTKEEIEERIELDKEILEKSEKYIISSNTEQETPIETEQGVEINTNEQMEVITDIEEEKLRYKRSLKIAELLRRMAIYDERYWNIHSINLSLYDFITVLNLNEPEILDFLSHLDMIAIIDEGIRDTRPVNLDILKNYKFKNLIILEGISNSKTPNLKMLCNYIRSYRVISDSIIITEISNTDSREELSINGLMTLGKPNTIRYNNGNLINIYNNRDADGEIDEEHIVFEFKDAKKMIEKRQAREVLIFAEDSYEYDVSMRIKHDIKIYLLSSAFDIVPILNDIWLDQLKEMPKDLDGIGFDMKL